MSTAGVGLTAVTLRPRAEGRPQLTADEPRAAPGRIRGPGLVEVVAQRGRLVVRGPGDGPHVELGPGRPGGRALPDRIPRAIARDLDRLDVGGTHRLGAVVERHPSILRVGEERP